MPRIISGQARGRQLAVPTSGTRPTPDRVRESIFSSLGHLFGSWEGVEVLDLYAGSGALGLEALSRGASGAVLVESDATAAKVCLANAAHTRLPARVVRRSVELWLKRESVVVAGGPFDLVLMDPPYGLAETEVALVGQLLVEGGWLSEGCVVVIERSRHSPEPVWPPGFEGARVRRFGDTVICSAIWYVPTTLPPPSLLTRVREQE